DAMHDAKIDQLMKLTALPLTVTDAEINDGSLIWCHRSRVASRKELARLAGDGNSLFAEPATPAPNGTVSMIFDCTRSEGRAVPTPVAPLAGARDVAFVVGGTTVALRISKAGQVVFVSALHVSPGI